MTDTIERHTITTYEADPNLVVGLNVRFESGADLQPGWLEIGDLASACGHNQPFNRQENPGTKPGFSQLCRDWMRLTPRNWAAALLCTWLMSAGIATADTPHVTDDPAEEAAPVAENEKQRPWGFAVYTTWLTREQLGDVLLVQSQLERQQLWVAALSRKIGSLGRHVDAEIEGQIGKHSGPLQHHWEVNALGALRWKTFPWNDFLNTSVAAGLGVSYALEDPQFEIEAHGKSNRLLAYVMIELTAALPKIPQWQLIGRIHHRSSAYGTFENDIEGASNSIGIGIRYRF